MAFHTQGFASSSQHTAHLLSATLHLKVQTHLKMNVSPSYVAPIIPPIRCHRSLQILVLAHTHCVVSQYKSSQRHPSTFTKPSQNDCLIILDTPSIPPISPHVPWNATHPTLKSPHFTHLPSIHPLPTQSVPPYTTLTPHLLFSLAEISICVRVRARNTHFDPFTKLNLNSSLDRANSNTYNPWEMISRLQTIAQTVPFDSLFYT